MNLDLTHKTALVCGSTQGIGFAAAMELSRLGASVVLMARDKGRLEEALHRLPVKNNQSHNMLQADFSDPESVKKAISGFLGTGRMIHILVNNTGGPAGGPITEASTDAFIQTFSQHLICNHILAQALLPGMKSEGYGRIINIISTSVKVPLHGLGVSNTIRGAVANWSKTMANEVAQFGITVNNVLPGATNTGRLHSIIHNKAGKTGQTATVIEAEMAKEVPMKRIGEPEEIAAAVAFLASPAASYISGINLPVDGGRTGCL